MITSNQNPRIKLVRALLGRPKERREAKAFVAEGVRLLEEAARAEWSMQFVLYDESLSPRGRQLLQHLTTRGVEVEEVEPRLLQSLGDTETSQGILAVLDIPKITPPPSGTFCLIPDQVRDPGNLGTLLRSAEAAGADLALIPPGTTDPFAPKVVRAGMGAHFRLPIIPMEWDEIRSMAKDRRVLLADMDGESCWETDLRQPLILIIGGEAEGASEEGCGLATQRICIPMRGNAESLNAAVAGSVLMFEVMRQRRG
jgi:TrmH family RNA methyltransferase